jgi:hypothetical protein
MDRPSSNGLDVFITGLDRPVAGSRAFWRAPAYSSSGSRLAGGRPDSLAPAFYDKKSCGPGPGANSSMAQIRKASSA